MTYFSYVCDEFGRTEIGVHGLRILLHPRRRLARTLTYRRLDYVD
jgi:hypothetical protein